MRNKYKSKRNKIQKGGRLMDINYEKAIHKASNKPIFNFLKERKIIEKENSLKLITVTVGNVQYSDLERALDFSVRSFNNLLERKFTKKAIKKSIRVLKSNKSSLSSSNLYSKYGTEKSLWLFYGKSVNEVITGGFYKIETTPSLKEIGLHNLHIHILCESGFIPQPLLSVIWQDVLSKPFKGKYISSEGICDVRNVGNTEEDVIKIIAYLDKPNSVINNESFKNVRLLSKFGTWYNNN